MGNPDTINIKPSTQHHYARTTLAAIFGFVAVALIMVSILVVWLGHTLINTNEYVRTVAPLVTKSDVQNFVVTKASSQLLDNKDVDIHDIASKLLPADQITGKSDADLKATVSPIITGSLQTVVSSPAFATLWKDNNRAVHASLISQLNSGAQPINLNFNPLIKGTINLLGTTKLNFVKDKLEIKDDAGQVAITGKQLSNVRKVYDYFKKAMIAIVAAAVLAMVLCVLVSVHHAKTFRRIALFTGIFSGLLALLLSATSLVKTGGNDIVQQKFMVALVNAITYDLRLSLIIIAIACIVGAIGSKLYGIGKARGHKMAGRVNSRPAQPAKRI